MTEWPESKRGDFSGHVFPHRYLEIVELPDDAQDQVVFFNAFMYKKLLEIEAQKAGCKRPNMEEMYKPAFAWVKTDDIFSKNSLLFPILDRSDDHTSAQTGYALGS